MKSKRTETMGMLPYTKQTKANSIKPKLVNSIGRNQQSTDILTIIVNQIYSHYVSYCSDFHGYTLDCRERSYTVAWLCFAGVLIKLPVLAGIFLQYNMNYKLPSNEDHNSQASFVHPLLGLEKKILEDTFYALSSVSYGLASSVHHVT